jgi:hypothetical protein
MWLKHSQKGSKTPILPSDFTIHIMLFLTVGQTKRAPQDPEKMAANNIIAISTPNIAVCKTFHHTSL